MKLLNLSSIKALSGHLAASFFVCLLAPIYAVAAHPAPRALSSDFVISDNDDNAVKRAFFYNGKTVIEFSGYPVYFSAVDAAGKTISFQREAKFARLAGRQENFIASVDGKKIEFKAIIDEPKTVEPKQAVATKNEKDSSSVRTSTQSAAIATPPVQTYTPAIPPAALVQPVAPPPIQAPVHTWNVKPSHHWVRDVIEDWATEAGYEVIWETRNFPVSVTREKTISSGSFWDALTLLGMSYKFSDAPFQIQPTAFKQIIVQPMSTTDNNPQE